MLLLLIMEINSIGHILMLDVKNILIYHYTGMNDDNDVNDNVPVSLSFLTPFIIQTTHIVSSNLGIASTVQASVAAQSTALFSDNEYTGMYMMMVMIMLLLLMMMMIMMMMMLIMIMLLLMMMIIMMIMMILQVAALSILMLSVGFKEILTFLKVCDYVYDHECAVECRLKI